MVVFSVKCPGDIAALIRRFKISMPFDETPMRENVVMGTAEASGAAAMAARALSDWQRVNIMIWWF